VCFRLAARYDYRGGVIDEERARVAFKNLKSMYVGREQGQEIQVSEGEGKKP